ncbi:NUDIX hydrolase [Endozoicomonas arenosclerae]|uniref:NUDIX hydrolase n=1 Tax=Endozoicomonas arenosclerae TaxID=1633495 RepID=UPI000B2C48D9|nr:NUDIX domain-containing protein [Endozoicomonas arenosclerae]
MNIRNLAICLIEHNEKLFVAEGYDDVKEETFYRPLGGGVEFGELAEQTAVREFKEEMDTEIEVTSYLHTIQNIFTFNGQPGHEMVMLLSARFKDLSFYDKEVVSCIEEGTDFVAKWVNKHDFLEGNKVLYPAGLTDYLRKAQHQ